MDAMRLYHEGTAAVHRAILAMCEPRPSGALLDIGCGDGELTMRVAAATGVSRASALERDPSYASAAAARGVEVQLADLADRWPVPAQAFDVVHANQVIEHLRGTDHFLREIRRVLRPDGYALVCTNNLASWHNIVSLVLGAQPEPCHVSDERIVGSLLSDAPNNTAHSHLRVFTPRALRALGEYHGLRSEVVRGVAYYPLVGRAAELASRVDRRHAAYILHRMRPVPTAAG